MAGDIPWELRLTLRAGSVFYCTDRGLNSSEPHYFIVINSKPLEQHVLVLAVVTSQVERVKRWRRSMPRTTVEIGPGDYAELSKASIVDCNVVFRRSLRELVARMEAQDIVYKSDVSAGVLGRIQEAILASPLIEQEIRALVR